ncbi:MAG: SUMF1/EgtB/PvdO family nonheme iron enzyme [Polyangiaceae bacterium]
MNSPLSPPPPRKRLVAALTVSSTLVVLGALGVGLWMADRNAAFPEGSLKQNAFLPGEKPNEWRSVNGKHWQAVSSLPEEPTTVTDAREKTRGACPSGMVEVKGKYKLDSAGTDLTGEVERLQDQSCTDWISKEFPARCATFDRTQWLGLSAKLPTRQVHFCVDRFEYPNKLGANPVIVVTYTEAAGLCRSQGKRLCGESEWTFACEGEEATPYATGYVRDSDACVVDQPWKPFAEGALSPRDGERARAELDRLWQGRPSGARPSCRSSQGVYDMTGNVDEWTHTARTEGYASVLKGGYWGPVRARCRPATRAHNEQFVAYQQGFRCCSDVPKEPAIAPPSDVTLATNQDDAGAPVDAAVPIDLDGGAPDAMAEHDASAPSTTPSSTAAPSPAANGRAARVKALVQAGLEAGALEPEDYDDEAELLRRYKKRVGCSNASIGGSVADGTAPFVVAVASVVLAMRRVRRARRHKVR